MKPKHILFIGIVGHAMRGIALAARKQGHHITGLDESAPIGDPGAAWLDAQNIEWTREPDPSLLNNIDLIVISGGTPADHSILTEAKKRGIAVTSFAEYLGELTAGKHVITVAGTHGKTTTTSLITWLLDAAGRHPDYLIGIRPFNFDTSARLEGADTFVVEGDEYKASNLNLQSKVQFYHPDVMVLTSVEHDHPDVFADLQSVITRFQEVVERLPRTGRLVAWTGSSNVATVAAAATCPVVTYGLDAGDYTAAAISYHAAGIEFDIMHLGKFQGRITVPLYGKHNITNALAAVIVALEEGLTMEQIIAGAGTFRGAYRRFQILTSSDATITVIDDYAHHPTEVATTLEAARLHFPGRRIVAVFRPHTYSRTQALLTEYHRAFGSADLAYITDIEGAREQGKTHSVSGLDVAKGLAIPTKFTTDRSELAAQIRAAAEPGDVVVCMTVSGYENLAGELASGLNS